MRLNVIAAARSARAGLVRLLAFSRTVPPRQEHYLLTALVVLFATAVGSGKSTETFIYVSLNTVDDHWVSASRFSGPTATATSIGSHEVLQIVDSNGGDLNDGDDVFIRYDGYALSVYNGESPPHFDEDFYGGYWEEGRDEWTVIDNDCVTSGCTVQSGDKLGFQNKNTGKYLYAVGGGGGNVYADSTSPGIYGRFEIIF